MLLCLFSSFGAFWVILLFPFKSLHFTPSPLTKHSELNKDCSIPAWIPEKCRDMQNKVKLNPFGKLKKRKNCVNASFFSISANSNNVLNTSSKASINQQEVLLSLLFKCKKDCKGQCSRWHRCDVLGVLSAGNAVSSYRNSVSICLWTLKTSWDWLHYLSISFILSWRFQPNANLMKCRWSSLWWLALRTSLHRAVRGPVWTESMNKQVHSWSCGMFHSPTTSRCDHKRLYRKLGFGLVLFQRQSLPPLPFSFSETFTFFCVYLTESSSHVLCILLNTMISSRPPHHM